MKKLICFILTFIIITFMTGCTYNYYGGVRNIEMGEWISPDGVHYWCRGHQMAPRYDHNGNLIID